MFGIGRRSSMYTKSRKPKLRITQSLLSAWQYSFKREDGWDDFLAALNREKKRPTKAMLDGTRFENCLNNVLNGEEIKEDHEWYKPIRQLAKYLDGSQQQVVLFKDIEVADQPILLHGVLDFLKAGVIYDTKYSKNYHLNKYLDSPQHPMYLELVPEARRFEYLSCDGEWVYRECYPRDIVEPIQPTIKHFLDFLKANNLYDIYSEKWRVNN